MEEPAGSEFFRQAVQTVVVIRRGGVDVCDAAAAQLMGGFVALVLQEGRNRDIPGLLHKSLRRPESAFDRVALWRRGAVYGRHGQREGAFRHADAFHG